MRAADAFAGLGEREVVAAVLVLQLAVQPSRDRVPGTGNPVQEQEFLDRQLDAGVAAQRLCSHAGTVAVAAPLAWPVGDLCEVP